MTVLSGGGDLVDLDRFETLKLLFEIVRDDGWVSAKAIGRKFPDGKRAANSDLYRFHGVLFKKRGLAPPEWSVVSDDAFDRWVAEAESRVQSAESQQQTKRYKFDLDRFKRNFDPTPTPRSEIPVPQGCLGLAPIPLIPGDNFDDEGELAPREKKEWPRINRVVISDVQVCNSCERPVNANGICGCS